MDIPLSVSNRELFALNDKRRRLVDRSLDNLSLVAALSHQNLLSLMVILILVTVILACRPS